MKEIIAMSLESCFRFVRDHNNTGYVMISIDSESSEEHQNVVNFNRTERCTDILYLWFDDVEEDNGCAFTDDDANDIIDFVKKNEKYDTLIVHCFGGVSRSQAVKHALIKCLGLPEQEKPFMMNKYVYTKIIDAWENDVQNNRHKP